MKPIESNNNSIILNNSETNKRQKKDGGQLPQTPSNSNQDFSAENKQDNNFRVSIPSLLNQDGDSRYFNVYREETTSLSSWFGAGQNSLLGELADIAVASSQQSLSTSYTNTFEPNNHQRKKLDSAVNRHAEFFQEYGSENSLDMALVTKAVSAFTYHRDIQKMLECACYYFRPRKNNQETSSDKLIENAGVIAEAFLKPIKYYEYMISNVSLKMEKTKTGQINLYSRTEQVMDYQPLKHIFTFLQSGEIGSLKSLEKTTLSRNKQGYNNIDKFNKLLIKVILNYGNFADSDNHKSLVFKLRELKCDEKILSELKNLVK